MKLIKQTLRKRIALGIEGTPSEIQGRLDSLINWKAIDSYKTAKHEYDGLHLGNPMSFQYVLLSEESLRDYFINLVSLDYDIEVLDRADLPLLAAIRNQANLILHAIPEARFLPVVVREGEHADKREHARAEIKEQATHYALTGK